MEYKKLNYKKEQKVGRITLNDPEKLNSLTSRMLKELDNLFEEISEKEEVNCLIIEGSGKAFSAGHDLSEIYKENSEEIEKLFQKCSKMMRKLRDLPQPVIAKVSGPAAAAGCQLVAACDLAVADENAKFTLPGIKLASFCSTPEVFVSRNIGRKRAFEMGITGEPIDAAKASEWGLVNRVVEEEKLEEETNKLAEKIAKYKLPALRTAKRMFYKQLNREDFQALDYATEVISLNFARVDAQEEVGAFLEGEKEL